MANPIPTDIKIHTRSRSVEITFDDGTHSAFTHEFLRVNSPSAEVRGHGPGQETLQLGKENVVIEAVEPVGNYAVKFRFSDGHDSGIYSWDVLYELARNRDQIWDDYLRRCCDAGYHR